MNQNNHPASGIRRIVTSGNNSWARFIFAEGASINLGIFSPNHANGQIADLAENSVTGISGNTSTASRNVFR